MKILKNILLLFIIGGIIIFTGCKNLDSFKPITSGDFIYTCNDNDSDEGHCRIIGLSDEGKQKEVIIFPTVLDGYIVDGLCASWALGRPSGDVIITNAEKIYIPSDYNMRGSSLYFELNHNKDIKVYCVDYNFLASLEYNYFTYEKQEYIGWNHLFVTETVYNEVYSKYGNIMKLEKANVVYYVDDDVYFIDDCDGTTINVIPPIPYKEGYEFLGWYKEQECINQWDFKNDLVDKKEFDEEGKYIFKETKIYAKWKEI